MKTVGKQLQEARLAKNWTPELAARETKIRVDRLRDLEGDDYSQFSSPTYARGFVRTYARSLGLDEYKLLRQLDNKLPEDDNASFANDSGVPYIPEPSRSHRSNTSSGSNAGLYVLTSLVFGILLVISFVLFQAYRAGELQRYFAQPAPESVVVNTPATNAPPLTAGTEANTKRALPVDPNAPVPPAVDAVTNVTTVPVPAVDSGSITNSATTNAAPVADAPIHAVKALPVDPADLANAPSPADVTNAPPTSANSRTTVVIPPSDADAKTPPRALPVDLAELNAADPAATAATNVVVAPTPPPAPPVNVPPGPAPLRSSARASSASTISLAHSEPSPTPIPATATSAADLALVGKGPVVMPTNAAPRVPTPPPAPEEKRLVLTASRDSFVRVTSLDASDNDKPLYARVLKSGQSVGFAGRKFSINVGIPSAIDITLDGVNYGPHSDQEAPETFSVESHQP